MKRMQTALTILAVMMLAAGSAFGGSAIIGSVAGSKSATIDGQALVPNTTVFSGDSLRVKEGAAAAAEAAGEAANAAGCALNSATDSSAYTPPAGFSCD